MLRLWAVAEASSTPGPADMHASLRVTGNGSEVTVFFFFFFSFPEGKPCLHRGCGKRGWQAEPCCKPPMWWHGQTLPAAPPWGRFSRGTRQLLLPLLRAPAGQEEEDGGMEHPQPCPAQRSGHSEPRPCQGRQRVPRVVPTPRLTRQEEQDPALCGQASPSANSSSSPFSCFKSDTYSLRGGKDRVRGGCSTRGMQIDSMQV